MKSTSFHVTSKGATWLVSPTPTLKHILKKHTSNNNNITKGYCTGQKVPWLIQKPEKYSVYTARKKQDTFIIGLLSQESQPYMCMTSSSTDGQALYIHQSLALLRNQSLASYQQKAFCWVTEVPSYPAWEALQGWKGHLEFTGCVIKLMGVA